MKCKKIQQNSTVAEVDIRNYLVRKSMSKSKPGNSQMLA